MAPAQATNRYPRPGERVAPHTLREFLLEPVPELLGQRLGEPALKLCDLDEAVWERFPAEVIGELAHVVVDRIAAQHVRKAFQHRHFPRPPEGTDLSALQLENRTRRCLVREGFDERPQSLGDRTIGEIMSMRAFGPRCLVDLLSALESRRRPARGRLDAGRWGGQVRTSLSEQLSAAAARLAALPGAELARREDPRFARLMHAVDVEAGTARELSARLAVRTHDPPDAAYVAGQVEQLAERIARMPRLTIEAELIEVFAAQPPDRNAEILVSYYGWDDGRQRTLTAVGDRFGITRERIRQICAKLTRKPKGLATILAPVMDRTLALIQKRLPAAAAALEAELRRLGLTAVGMSLEGVAAGARLLDRRGGFCVVKLDSERRNSPRLAVRPDQIDAVPVIADAAKKEVYFHGLTTLSEVERQAAAKCPGAAAELVRQTLQQVEGFAWLDERSGWFRIDGIGKHGLPRTVDKVLAVAGAVSAAQLRQAVGRNRRLWKEPPPEEVLLEFCRHLPGVKIEGRRIIAAPPRDWRQALTGVELKLVSVLHEHGPVMERGQMEDLCVGDGMNRFSFHAFVSWSPVLVQLGHSVYGLLGSAVSPAQIDALAAARRASRATRRVLDRHGWTPDGKVWLSYRLSKAASTYAVITVPAALKKVVRGRFTLLSAGGDTIGTLATKEGRAWGLGAFLRQNGARIDDHILLTLDLKERTATVAWAEEEGIGIKDEG